MRRWIKLWALGSAPSTWGPLFRTRTAAGVEHLQMLREVRPDTLLDVGANKGQFSLAARSAVSALRIIAFEPLSSEAAIFRRNLEGARDVQLKPFALAAERGLTRFHVADRTDSSSLLRLGSKATDAYGIKEAKTIEIEQHRLDEVVTLKDLVGTTLLKLDVQGAEALVLAGASALLGRIDFIYAELSFVPLYEGQALAGDVVALLAQHGFALRGVYNNSYTAAFGATQADFLFVRANR